MSAQRWEITGLVEVEEGLTTGRRWKRRRPLAGVTVEIVAAADGARMLACLGQSTTDANGRYRLVAQAQPASLTIGARVLLAGERLVVADGADDGLLRRGWITVHTSAGHAGGGLLDLGRHVFREDAATTDAARDVVRRAILWSVAQEALAHLAPVSRIHRRIALFYPAASESGPSSADRARGVAVIHRDATHDEWNLENVLRQLAHLLSDDERERDDARLVDDMRRVLGADEGTWNERRDTGSGEFAVSLVG